MPVLLYFKYFLNSLRQRGFTSTCLIPFFEWKYERYFGIKTAGIKKSDSEQFLHYQGVTYYTLFRMESLLRKYAYTHAFFDIGCGKGRAMAVAAYFGFKEINGIELDNELTEIAQRNLLERLKFHPEVSFSIKTANAIDINYPAEPQVFFLFNRFDAQTLKHVLQRIGKNGLTQHVFIYVNPLHKKVFLESGFNEEKIIYTKNYCEAIVFRHPYLGL